MPKTTDVPAELKEFNKVFNQVSYAHDDDRVFSDFIDVCISNFQLVPTPGLRERMLNTYSEKELTAMGDLVMEYFNTMERVLAKKPWHDLLGTYYEVLASKSRKSTLGQFFTPQEICDLTTSITIPAKTEGDRLLKLSDPASGSGRMLLSSHIRLKGQCICYAEDLDSICARMTVLNFLSHGVVGEVIHHDSLMPESFYNGWHVNYMLMDTKIPSVRRIGKEDSFVIKMWQQRAAEVADKRKNEQPPAASEEPAVAAKQGQLFM